MRSRRISRSRSRGAAFTELMAIMPAFVIVNMAGLHLSSAYSSAQSSMRNAHNGAWSPAMSGCQGSRSTATEGAQATSSPSDSSLASLSPRVSRVLPNAGSPGIRAPLSSLDIHTSGADSTTHSTGSSNDWALFQAADYARSSKVVCNEVPKAIQDPDEKSAVNDAWKRFVQ